VVFRSRADLPLLRSAFLLPVRWLPGPDHSPQLPRELIELATRIVAQVPPGDGRSWSLHPADGLDLSGSPLNEGLLLGCGSAWAALTGGLVAVSGGLETDARVWASGAWNRNGLASVEGLEEKLALATDWGTTDFFVPAWQMDDAQKWVDREAPGRLGIGRLSSPPDPGARDGVQVALGQLLARLTRQPEVPRPGQPDEPEAFEKCRSYFLYQPAFSGPERAFYRSHLFEGIVRRLRGKVQAAWPAVKISHLVTVVSPSHELALLAARALNVQHCLLLYQRETTKRRHRKTTEELARDCKQTLEAREPRIDCPVAPFGPGARMWTDIAQAVSEFSREVAREQLVLDLKPGTKRMTYSLSRVARPGNWLFNLEADFLADRRTDPGTEEPELWQVPSEP
jgi:hypothetical protein